MLAGSSIVQIAFTMLHRLQCWCIRFFGMYAPSAHECNMSKGLHAPSLIPINAQSPRKVGDVPSKGSSSCPRTPTLKLQSTLVLKGPSRKTLRWCSKDPFQSCINQTILLRRLAHPCSLAQALASACPAWYMKRRTDSSGGVHSW